MPSVDMTVGRLVGDDQIRSPGTWSRTPANAFGTLRVRGPSEPGSRVPLGLAGSSKALRAFHASPSVVVPPLVPVSGTQAAAQSSESDRSLVASVAPSWILPGREDDARVASIAFQIATAGNVRCPVGTADAGMVLQHLSQFELADRAALAAALELDRGPGVIAVVPGSPAEAAGIRAGDVLIAIDDASLPPEPGLALPFDAARAHSRADAVHALLLRPGRHKLSLRRAGEALVVGIDPVPACASRVHLARSDQRNAYADGTRILITTGLLRRLANDDEVAFVLAHEMAHNILGHAALMRRGTVRTGLGRTMGKSGAVVRATEAEADALAGALMLNAGFDPGRGAEALRHVGGIDLGIGLFAAHEPTGERIAKMRALAAGRAPR